MNKLKRIRSSLKALFRDDSRALRNRFTEIYKYNGFHGSDSISGTGSGMEQTRVIRGELPKLLKQLNVRSVLDVPCGDWFWMKSVDLGDIHYTGGDIVTTLVEANRKQFQNAKTHFRFLNVVWDLLPRVDLIFCRDLFVHLTFADCNKAIANMKRSGSKYLFTTTFPTRESNSELSDVWRTLNLEKGPFNFPPPLLLLNEGCTEDEKAYTDKSLGLWLLESLDDRTKE